MNMANQSDKKGPKAGVPYDGDNEAYDGFYFLNMTTPTSVHQRMHLSGGVISGLLV